MWFLHGGSGGSGGSSGGGGSDEGGSGFSLMDCFISIFSIHLARNAPNIFRKSEKLIFSLAGKKTEKWFANEKSWFFFYFFVRQDFFFILITSFLYFCQSEARYVLKMSLIYYHL